MSRDKVTTPTKNTEDEIIEKTLRPQSLKSYQGQEKAKKHLKILIQAAQKRKEPLDHILLSGPAGLGKTTLSYIIARELNTNIKITSGPAIERGGDLASILTNLQLGDILFIDEAHRLNRNIEEILYPAMEDYKLDLTIGKGPSARTIQIEIPRFTLIAATTRVGLLSSPLRSRFGVHFRLEFYRPEEIQKIIQQSAKILQIKIDEQSAFLLAQASRSTPRVANRLLKRARDFAQVKDSPIITPEIIHSLFKILEIDRWGLELIDYQIIQTIIKKFDGGPAGIQSIAAVIGEEAETIEDVYEPYLLQLGLIARTPRGRIATKAGYEYLGLTYPEHQQKKLI